MDVRTTPVTTGSGDVGAEAALRVSETEARLRASEARYRTLFESIDEGFCVIEVLFEDDEGPGSLRPVDYRFLEANPAFVAQTGLVNAVGRRIRELVPAHESHWFEIYGRVALTGEPTRFEAPAEALGRWYNVYAFRLGEPHEHRVAVLFDDISARKRVEAERERLAAEVATERERLEALVRHMPAPVALLLGPEHRHALVNAEFRRISGGGRDVTGLTVREAFPEFAGQGVFERLDQVYASGEPWVGPESHVRYDRDGTGVMDTWFDVRFVPMRAADGNVVGIINFAVDVTEQVLGRREIERVLRESERARAEADAARREAEAANRAKAQFLAVMSHELRTPLNAIGGYADLLEMGIRGPITSAQSEDLRRIQVSQRHLLGLINEVLNYARLETGTVHYDLAAVRVRDALAGAEALVAPQARAKGLTLSMGECPPDLLVRADAEKLRQILVNLLSNAVKFTDRGGRIELACTATEERVGVTVRDTGIGIAADQLERIFDPFVQVRSELTRTAEGTGLGLAISRDLARGMGGDLTAESEPRVGSVFTLVLPRA
jgi:PAS domain S-box-containing protein